MLKQLTIENFAIIDHQTINFEDHLNVITGETGSGKSILMEALELICGGRFRKTMIREEGKQTLVEGVFLPSQEKRENLQSFGFSEEYLTIQRIIDPSGRSQALVNGRLVNLSVLEEMTKILIDIHGQNENQSLLQKENYPKLIDQQNLETFKIQQDLGKLLVEIHQLELEKEQFNLSEEDKERQVDLLEYQLSEMNELDLENLDLEEIEENFYRLQNMRKIQEEVSLLLNSFQGDDYENPGLLSGLNSAFSNLTSLEEVDPQVEEYREEMGNILYTTEELVRNLSSYESSLYLDEEELERLNTLLEKITNLQRKYGKNLEDIIEYRDQIKNELDEIAYYDERKEELERKIKALFEKAQRKADELTSLRKEIARDLEVQIVSNIRDLNMPYAEFQIDFQKKKLSKTGQDDIEFLLKTNKGSKFGPLQEIASGGERSRIMLGFKAVLAHVEELDTLVFDEIDAGISGRTGQVVGEKMLDLSKNHQVLVISHLPQIAALSDHHYYIEKYEENEETLSRVLKIQEKDRVEELARIIGGVKLTETTRKQALEMLDQGKKLREMRK